MFVMRIPPTIPGHLFPFFCKTNHSFSNQPPPTFIINLFPSLVISWNTGDFVGNKPSKVVCYGVAFAALLLVPFCFFCLQIIILFGCYNVSRVVGVLMSIISCGLLPVILSCPGCQRCVLWTLSYLSLGVPFPCGGVRIIYCLYFFAPYRGVMDYWNKIVISLLIISNNFFKSK